MPDALVGDLSVFATLSAIKEEAEKSLHDMDPGKQHERMVTLFENAVSTVLYTLVGDQSLPCPMRKTLRSRMLANDQVSVKAERARARKNALAVVNPKETKKQAKVAKRARKIRGIEARELTEPLTYLRRKQHRPRGGQVRACPAPAPAPTVAPAPALADNESSNDGGAASLASFVHFPAPAPAPSTATVEVPAGSWWKPDFIAAAVHAQTNTRLGLSARAPARAAPAALPVHGPLPVPWWVGVPVPAAQAAAQAAANNEVVDLIGDSD